ncbi:MAG: alkaline phosphatase family protein [Phycisphaerae bacterium]|nr:alkaline phosphatase family protein [Phycisphaerae bacterium]
MTYPWRDRRTPRMLLIGLDGIPFKRLSQWTDQGRLPNIAELLRNATAGPLESTIPPTTSPAWQVCFTGKNPGKLGLYGFSEPRPFDVPPPPLVPVDSRPIAGQTLFDVLSRAGKRVIARQVRCCYPAWEINGYMQTGFPTPSPRDPRRFWPRGPEAMARLMDHRAEKRRDANIPWGWFSLEQSAEAYLRELRKECDVVVDDLRRMDFDYYCNVVGATDGLQHLFWLFGDPYLPITDRERRLFGDVTAQGYRMVDRLVARLLDVVPTEVPMLFVSDHGGGPEATRLFRLNHWLTQQGWLTPSNPADAQERPVPRPLRDQPDTPERRATRAKRLDANRRAALKRQAVALTTSYIRAMLPEGLVEILRGVTWRPYTTPQLSTPKPYPFDMTRTKAYGYPFGECCGSVVINLRGRQSQGVVDQGEDDERLRAEIIDALIEMKDPSSNRPICEAVWRREELYQGPYAEQAPDIVFLLSGDYKADYRTAGPLVDNADETTLFARSGEHTRWGTCIARGDAFPHRGQRRDDARLIDVAPTSLALMRVPVPCDMDGRVLSGWLSDEITYQTGPPSPTPTVEPAQQTAPEMTEEEMAQVTERLRDLGYVE